MIVECEIPYAVSFGRGSLGTMQMRYPNRSQHCTYIQWSCFCLCLTESYAFDVWKTKPFSYIVGFWYHQMEKHQMNPVCKMNNELLDVWNSEKNKVAVSNTISHGEVYICYSLSFLIPFFHWLGVKCSVSPLSIISTLRRNSRRPISAEMLKLGVFPLCW